MDPRNMKIKTKVSNEPGFVDSLAEFFSNHSFLTIIFGVLIYELYTRTNHEVKRFRYLTKLLGELESSYQKI